jgi:hypothetical protein
MQYSNKKVIFARVFLKTIYYYLPCTMHKYSNLQVIIWEKRNYVLSKHLLRAVNWVALREALWRIRLWKRGPAVDAVAAAAFHLTRVLVAHGGKGANEVQLLLATFGQHVSLSTSAKVFHATFNWFNFIYFLFP